jgi:A/G-specific adenine glycosylase
VVDGNVDRLLARYLALDQPVREAKNRIRTTVHGSVPDRAGDFAQALMDLGATICTPRVALCPRCPLQPACAGARTEPLRYPVKQEKPVRPTRYGHAFVVFDPAGRVFLQARPTAGLLGAMTGVPTTEWSGARTGPAWPAPAAWHRHVQVVHVFTHFRLELEVWSATLDDPAMLPGGWWAEVRELHAEALPTVFRKVLAAAGLGRPAAAA